MTTLGHVFKDLGRYDKAKPLLEQAAEIRRRVGLTPKSLQRIARMRRLIEELDARKPIRWSEEAVGAGYFDEVSNVISGGNASTLALVGSTEEEQF